MGRPGCSLHLGWTIMDEVRSHIRMCDRMYEGVWGRPDESPETSVCKRLLDMGVGLTSEDLPKLCILECERWSLKDSGWQPGGE